MFGLYKTDNVYVGMIGHIIFENGKSKVKNPKSILYIQKEKRNNRGEYYIEDIITKKRYSPKEYALELIIPLNKITEVKVLDPYQIELLDENLDKIIEKYIKRKKDITEEKNKKISNPMLKMLSETSVKVQESSLSKKQKKYLIKELEDLGEYYIKSLKKIEKETLTLNNDLSIKKVIVKKIVEIEEKCQSDKLYEDLELEQDYKKLRKELKKKIETIEESE